MIGKTGPRGTTLYGVLSYLFGPKDEEGNVHVDPRVVAGWRPPGSVQPPQRGDGTFSVGRLDRLMRAPLKLMERPPKKYVYHLILSAAPEDPVLSDAQWERICARAMDLTGLDPADPGRAGVPWVAVRHDARHVHIAAVLARTDGTRPSLSYDWPKIDAACRWAEREFGLRAVRSDRTAAKRPTRAETAKAVRTRQAEPARTALARTVRSAAAAARDEGEFFGMLDRAGLAVRQRIAPSGDVTGYAVGRPGDLNAGGDQVLFGGGRLAPELTLPKLRRRWTGQPGPGPGRLTGRAMPAPVARAVLAREVRRAARAARSETEFFTGLAQAGLRVRYRADPGRPGRPAGYAVTLPGLRGERGRPAWHAGGSLAHDLSLGQLRARWRAGQAGAAPGPEAFAGADRAAIFEYAAEVAENAAAMIGSPRTGPRARADAAWAAADVLTAAALATGSPHLQDAAGRMQRAAREPWGRTPARTRDGDVLRTTAWLLARCARSPAIGAALVIALAALALAVAITRARQRRHDQAAAARLAAARVNDCKPVDPAAPLKAPSLASMSFPARTATRPAARPGQPGPRPATPPGSRPRPRPRGPG